MKTKMFAAMTVLFLGVSLLAETSVNEASAANAILIDFSSASCPPCRAMEPILADLENAGVPVRHVDVRAEQDLARRYGIRQTPTYVIVVDGKEVTRLVGMQSIEKLRSALAINPGGPQIPTGAKSNSLDDYPTPRTRLAPMKRLLEGHQTLTTALPASTSSAIASEAMPSVNLADAIERAKAATVRLRVYDGKGFGAGTGTIVDTHGDEALVLTCGHLFRETEGQGKIEVDLFVGGEVHTVLGQVIDYDSEDRDVGLVAIRPGFPVIPVQVLGNDTKVRTGQTAFSFGCDRGDDPSRRDTRITGIDKYNQQLGVSNLEIEGAPIDGRSGGGLFDDAGRLIGVCNAADYKGDVGIYAGPGNIYWQFDRVNLARLYSQPQHNQPQRNQLAAAPERTASLDNGSLAAMGLPASALQPSATAPIGGDQEVIVIIRDRNNPAANSQVMTVAEPTAEFMQMVQQYAR
ncbi:Thioredoxin C-2 [Novipirellula aureliae]|uniref:Thioredoxin C-2 n=1 Tax=Novipirellula aureliae TaxID=2527966 RepID=A0A5C6E9Z8_9BACT|nr:trypsin-like peptidase domain-containing protein [Novipirellula aureliae]TWU45355.1 Thioredoxin C-2 [Novipirellula aureliae]